MKCPPYLKSAKINAFGQKICVCHKPTNKLEKFIKYCLTMHQKHVFSIHRKPNIAIQYENSKKNKIKKKK